MMMLLHAPQDFGDDRQEPRELTEKDLLSGSSEMLFIYTTASTDRLVTFLISDFSLSMYSYMVKVCLRPFILA